jgi:hypothetical protein
VFRRLRTTNPHAGKWMLNNHVLTVPFQLACAAALHAAALAPAGPRPPESRREMDLGRLHHSLRRARAWARGRVDAARADGRVVARAGTPIITDDDRRP